MTAPKPIKFNPGWLCWTAESDKPVTLPPAPWDTVTQEEPK